MQNTVHGGKTRADAVPYAHLFHQRQIGGLVHPDHGFPHPQRTGQQAGQHIVFLIFGHGNERVHTAHIFLHQEVGIRAVAVQNQRSAQMFRQKFATGRVALDNLHIHLTAFQQLGQPEADISAAHDAGR